MGVIMATLPVNAGWFTRFRDWFRDEPDDEYVPEDGDQFFTDAIGDVYVEKPDGRIYDLND